MQAYTELAAPTAVTHSLTLPLTSAMANNLVVAKGSLLQIFTTKTIPAEIDTQSDNATSGDSSSATKTGDSSFDPRANDDEGLESSFLGGGDSMLIARADCSPHTKLVLVAEIPLAGTVIGLARIKIRNTASGGDALLLAYKAAKMCLTEWDAEKKTLETLSLHYYEKDETDVAPWELPIGEYVNHLEADPGSRCAALKFGPRSLAILPFRQSEEDLEMDDWDEDLDGPRPVKENGTAGESGEDGGSVGPAHAPSFVVSLPMLDPSLLHPVHLAFLHEYREPTFGILSASRPPSATLNATDYLTYKVFTLDLQQRASTTILSVTDLPRDLFKVLPLPAPLGGALLVGENELIHFDQSGKPNGVAVNPMTKQVTSFNLVDQSDLELRLEGCTIEPLCVETGEFLIILNDGRLALCLFHIDGRTVTGISIKMVAADCGGHLVRSSASCASKLPGDAVFIGSESNDGIVLGWTRNRSQEKRKKSRIIDNDLAALGVDDADLDDVEEDDDLYGNDSGTSKPSAQDAHGNHKSGDLTFRIHDTLLSLAPIYDAACGKPAFVPDSEEAKLSEGVTANLELTCAVGSGRAGSLAIVNREIQPKVIGRFDFPEARGFWTMCVKRPGPKSMAANVPAINDYDSTDPFDRYMIVAKVDLDGYETSDVYALTAAGFESIKDTEFEPAAGFTVEAGVMGNQMRIIQVLKSETRCYDGDLGLAQILPMLDEETGAEPRVLSASIVDPYLLLVRDDGSAFVAQMDSANELEEVEKTAEAEILTSNKWTTGCLYKDTTGLFQETQGAVGEKVVMFLVNSAGALYVYALPDLSRPIYVAEGLSCTPSHLSADYAVRKGTPREILSQIVVADLGDKVSQTPHLILRHTTDDLTIYEPVRYQADGSDSTLSSTLRFNKCPNPAVAKSPPDETDQDDWQKPRFVPLRVCPNVGGYSTVFLPGPSPSFVIKSSKSLPRVVGVQGQGVRGMSPFHTQGCDRGFIYADAEGMARVTQLAADTDYAQLGLSVKKVAMDTEVRYVAYHGPSESYAIGCLKYEPFELPRDDDYHKEWSRETLAMAPLAARGEIRLVNPTTWTAINTVEMEPCETIESMRALLLEVSEETRERRMLIVIGSATSRGEDLPTKGSIRVLDIVAVIPEPGHPETNRRLKPVAQEDLPRGGVTALGEIGTQGLMLATQGQKTMVRGLKEDGSLLPVAFLDMNCHVASARVLARPGLCLLADAFKGVWFAGYTEEPYTFKVMGKTGTHLPALVADFLPQGDDLSIVVADAQGEMHIFEFNPEHPQSLQGSLLLHRTTFSVAPNTPTSSILLPRTSSSPAFSSDPSPHILLLTSPTGHLSAVTTLSEPSHRRLMSLSNQLVSALPAHGGLNLKAYRLPGTNVAREGPVGVDAAAGRSATVVDAGILARWADLAAAKKAELASRSGYDGVAEARAELAGIIGWSGLEYF
ncbi:cleavage and polyadenylation specificity factor subunit 1 [Geosmithia morbida]|uniref:Cleavage and polyadenylation specificity factor subunit 1 n=1 Tax=Geosmithia morbida TaxID=1094350 RepID=A0A9P4YZB1_9HYPO|nr:cleavage and polyadenylation specificity factor subunit 1 [Geosmithia morbida]KAF4124810.1 cleavage and polyadenylation specificity factor subunit 1 [Geosmithia morbida]